MEQEVVKTEKWYQTMTVKIALLAILGIMLLIPLALIQNVIRERAGYAEQTKTEIGRLWAAGQTITGPVLNVPGSKIVTKDGDREYTTLHILPEKLVVEGEIKPEKRHRGIYETVVYDSKFHLSGNFSIMDYKMLDDFEYDWSKAYISLGVTDNKGITDNVSIKLGEKSMEAEPGTGQSDIFDKGLSFPAGISGDDLSLLESPFIIELGLKGSGYMNFSPVGKTTEVALTSDWSSPSFQGTFLPADSQVDDKGFSAKWIVTHLNRAFPQAWTGERYKPENDSFGVDLMLQVDHYKKSERSAKYGLLFIIFTFFVLLIIELRSSERLHIFYYALVAFALILFFSLLSALSEHVGFNAAYLISSVAVIGLLSAFFRSLMKKWWVVVLISGLLTTLYAFIFVLLALKDYAYLVGNIGLFIILAVLMLVSSRYRLFSEGNGKSNIGII